MTSLQEHLTRVRELIEAARNRTGFHEPILNELSALEAAMQRVQQAEREKAQGLREALETASKLSEALPELNNGNYDHDEVVSLNNGSIELCLFLREALAQFDAKEEA